MVGFFYVFFSELYLDDCVYRTSWWFAGIFRLVCEIFWGVCAILFFFTLSVVDLFVLAVIVVSMALLRLWWCAHALNKLSRIIIHSCHSCRSDFWCACARRVLRIDLEVRIDVSRCLFTF